uniref:SFRICE_004116 n=1 Tax=Spodoptera frugiperda TaxID=7108 RepID=A0A2H1VPW3_SPOFR
MVQAPAGAAARINTKDAELRGRQRCTLQHVMPLYNATMYTHFSHHLCFKSHVGGAVFCTSRTGNNLITIGGYSFCYHRKTGLKTRWRCSTNQHKGCKAVIFTVDNTIIKINNNHNHSAVFSTSRTGRTLILIGGYRFCRQRTLGGAVFSTSRTGSKLIKIGGYSFCRHRSSGVKTRWNCSTGNFKGCKAAIYTIDNMIVKINNDHNHDPKKCCKFPIKQDNFYLIRAVFFTSKRGSDLISVKGFRFRRHRTKNYKTRWQCGTHHREGCSAVLYTNIFSVPYITQSKRGAYILMAAGYKFYRHCEIGTKTRWYCATNYHKGCKASAYTENFIVTKIKNIHNHGLQFVSSSCGNRILVYSGYRYRRHQHHGTKARWICSQNRDCKAALYTLNDELLTSFGDESIAVYWARYQTEEFSKIRKKLNVSYSYTQRGSKVVVLDGFRYTKHTTQGLRIRWRCSHHFSQNCTASIYTYEDKIYRANKKAGLLLSCMVTSSFGIGLKGPECAGIVQPTASKVAKRPLFYTTSRGARVLVVAGYKFYKHRSCGVKTRWACSITGKCKAMVYTIEDTIVRHNNNHCHPPCAFPTEMCEQSSQKTQEEVLWLS